MSTTQRCLSIAAASAVSLLLLSACATGPGSSAVPTIMKSYPPQCNGIPLDDWTRDDVEGSEANGETTWGTYAVYATYDGERLTNTDPPIMLALYDPIAPGSKRACLLDDR